VIEGREHHQSSPEGHSIDPAYPQAVLYTFSMADWDHVNRAVECAKREESYWSSVSISQKADIFAKAAQLLRQHRGDLIGAMMADGGKTILEGDPEVSEAIDFIEHHSRGMMKMHACTDIQWAPKGTGAGNAAVELPWISRPTGGIIAALAAGNCVLFKPAPEAVLSGWTSVNLLWEQASLKNILQFFTCHD
jgi:RHH-type proline utilization regulon transcriptional repressor/proline dehydrogenase/delta 1-pyrroline-5-carboxylate dehydrogenase